ncbi:MAG TPA: hypothetical protein VGF69_03385 [Thermoanaerobaculia bacterium]
MKLRWLLLCGSLFFAGAAFADDDVVKWIGTLERTLPDTPPNVINIPVTLATADAAKTPPQVRQVVLAGEEIDPAAVTATWSNGMLRVEAKADATKKVGTYTAFIHVAAPEKFIARTLEVKLVRRGATLTIPTPLRATRLLYFPGLHAWEPATWVVRDPSGRTDFRSYAPRWAVTLRTAETAPSGKTVYLDLEPVPQPKAQPQPSQPSHANTTGAPKTPPPPKPAAARTVAAPTGSQALLRPVDDSVLFPLGTLSGKFTVQDAQMAAPAEVTVEVVSRLSRWWLFLLIVGSIFAGHLTRKVLEGRRTLGVARLAGTAARAQLAELALSVKGDPAFAARADSALAALTRAMAGNDHEAVKAAVDAALQQQTAIRQDYDKVAKEASELLRTLRLIFGETALQSGELLDAARDLASRLDTAEAALAAGNPTQARDTAKKVESAVTTRVGPALATWRAGLGRLFDQLTRWPDVDVKTLTSLRTRLDAMAAGTLDEVKATFVSAADVNANLRPQIEWFASEAQRIVGEVRTALIAMNEPAVEEPVKLLRNAAEPLPRLANLAVTNPVEAAAQIRDARTALQAALRAAVPANQQAPAEIEEGRFAAAVAAVRKLRPTPRAPQVERGGGMTIALDDMAIADAAAAPPPAAQRDTLRIEIRGGSMPIAGETLHLTAHVMEGDAEVRNAEIQWSVGGAFQTIAPTFDYVPLDATPRLIKARTTVGNTSAEAILPIAPASAEIYDRSRIQSEIAKVTLRQTFIAGLLITTVGYLLFEKTFIGTLPDLIGAVLWGFATDVTVAKVVEYAQPYTQKKLT